MASRERRVKELGREAGFDLVRIADGSALEREGRRYLDWVDAGRHGQMAWITPEHVDRCTHPQGLLPGARSVICVGLGYWTGERPADSASRGRVARYAWGRDYHLVLKEKLEAFRSCLTEEFGGEHRSFVDTGPMMDKALAARSGLGWYGKNTNILTEQLGSFLFLGEILTTLDLRPDPPLARDCGRCRLCAVACPTGALGPDYSIDAQRCISYLTIEHRGPIPRELRSKLGDWVFGCDICQDVCPPTMAPYLKSEEERLAWQAEVRRQVREARSGAFLSKAAVVGEHGRTGHPADEVGLGVTPTPNRVTDDAAATASTGSVTAGADERTFPRHEVLDLIWLLRLTHEEYVEEFRGTAIKRAKDWMLRRNAAVALGNVGRPDAIAPLLEAARDDCHPIVRGHAVWAAAELGRRFDVPEVWAALRAMLETEEDPGVREEILVAGREGVRRLRRRP